MLKSQRIARIYLCVFNQQNSASPAPFENYQMDILKSGNKEGSQNARAYVPDDKTIRLIYEAAKSDRTQIADHDAPRTITVSSIHILASTVFFLTHWIWMRQLTKKTAD